MVRRVRRNGRRQHPGQQLETHNTRGASSSGEHQDGAPFACPGQTRTERPGRSERPRTTQDEPLGVHQANYPQPLPGETPSPFESPRSDSAARVQPTARRARFARARRGTAAQSASAAASHTTASYAVSWNTYAIRKNPRRLASQSLRSFALGRQSRCRQTLYAQYPPLRGALTSFAEHSHAHKFAAHSRTREPLRSRSTGGLPPHHAICNYITVPVHRCIWGGVCCVAFYFL
jgi:hypothetical protein